MLYRLFADVVVLCHLGFIVFVLAGGLLVLRWKRLAWAHVPSITWGMSTEFFGLWCPLTPLENWLRESSGGARYEVGFIEHYIMPIVYPEGLTREMQIAMGSLALLVNGLIYGILCRKVLRARARNSSGAKDQGTR